MQLGTILKIAGVLLIALVVAAVAFALNLDPNDHKDRIAEMVKEETGRDIVFGGPMDLDIGMTTRLVVRDVSFSNVGWGSRAQLANVGLMEVEVRLLPMLSGNLDIERVVLRDADVLVETDAQGRSNLDFGGEESARDEDGDNGSSLGLGIGQLRIENLKITFIDGVEGHTLVAALERAIAVPASPGAPLDIDVKGKVTLDRQDAKIALDGQVGSLEAILSGREPVPINLKGELVGYDVTVEGGVRQPQNPGGFDVQIHIAGDGLATIQPFIGKSLPKVGPVTLGAHVTGNPDHPVIENILV
ncbi:MAG: AsmA family protein, partial [Alphaproteobacteria bacterium]